MLAAEFPGLDQCNIAPAGPLPPTFSAIAARVGSVLPFLCGQEGRGSVASPAGLRHLRSCFSQEECPRIDYDRYGKFFAYGYFLENYWKAAASFQQLGVPLAERIADLGCGSGATILAYLTTIEQSRHGTPLMAGKHQVHVELLDRSQAQLSLAREILQRARPALRHLHVDVHSRCVDLEAWHPPEKSADVLLFGHVLNENRATARSLLEKAIRAACDGGRIYVIERKHDTIWRAIEQQLDELPLGVQRGAVSLENGNIKLPASHEARDKESIHTGYLELRLPQRKVLAYLLRLYFQAWQSQRLDLLDEVFALDAEYHEKPHQPPLVGLEAIKGYWREKVLPQRDLSVRVIRSAYGDVDAFAEWEARFSLSEQPVQVNGTLVLTVDPAAGRVVALHEYFRRQDLRE